MTARVRNWSPIALFVLQPPSLTLRLITALRACADPFEGSERDSAHGPGGIGHGPTLQKARVDLRRLGNETVYVPPTRRQAPPCSLPDGGHRAGE